MYGDYIRVSEDSGRRANRTTNIRFLKNQGLLSIFILKLQLCSLVIYRFFFLIFSRREFEGVCGQIGALGFPHEVSSRHRLDRLSELIQLLLIKTEKIQFSVYFFKNKNIFRIFPKIF